MTDLATLPGLRERLVRHPLREQIAAGLAAQIEAGLLLPGDELPSERDLATLLEVGRESVRAALQVLATYGMVEISHGARCRVVGPASGALADRLPPLSRRFGTLRAEVVTDARLALEPMLTGRAAVMMDEAALNRLRRLVQAQGGMLDDPVRFQISDREFHLLLHREAGNPILAAYAEEVYAHAFAWRHEVMRFAGGSELAWRDHRIILDAFEAHDAPAATAAMAAHIEHIQTLVAGFRNKRHGHETRQLEP